MSAAVWVSMLTFSALSAVASGVLSGPTEVRLSSRNLNLMLTWEPAAAAPSGLIYSTEFTSMVAPFREGCVNISALQCDLIPFNISPYGRYRGRVRAVLGAEASAWVESNNITLDKDTLIGPPSVALLSLGPTLEVSIKDPVFQISPLRNVYSNAAYNITFWKKGEKHQATNMDNIQQDRVVLNELEPLSEYCVQVHINTMTNKNPGEPSSPICEKTGKHDELPWVAAVIVVVIVAAAVALTVLVVLKWKNISQVFWPKVSLPKLFGESLKETPETSVCLALQPTEEVDPVSVVTPEEDAAAIR
uniref:Interleukin-10 receptor subunit beta-like n=1 Tax=Fundulus heteroclitus TaxID=8078 RepID=A0A3Q2TTV6_FUNHE